MEYLLQSMGAEGLSGHQQSLASIEDSLVFRKTNSRILEADCTGEEEQCTWGMVGISSTGWKTTLTGCPQ